jgi:hypothetical protein
LQEFGAETKARSEITVGDVVDFVKDPLANDTVKVRLTHT